MLTGTIMRKYTDSKILTSKKDKLIWKIEDNDFIIVVKPVEKEDEK